MKIGVIADTHIPERAKDIPKDVLKAFNGADMIIHAGDLVCLDVLKTLKDLTCDLRAVYGNMDPYEVRERIKEKEVIRINNFVIGVTHGYGNPVQLIDWTTRLFQGNDPDMIIFGHSHNATNLTRNNVLYFNPGSPTDKIFALYNSYGIIDIGDKIDARIIKING